MTYVFMPELVGVWRYNLSKWIIDNQLLIKNGFTCKFDVEKALKIEHELRTSEGNGEPTLCFTTDEMIEHFDQRLPKTLLLKVLDEHFNRAKQSREFYEYITAPYFADRCLRLINCIYRSGDFTGWTEITVQVVQKYKKKWKEQLVDRSSVLNLGFHVEKADNALVKKYLVKLEKKNSTLR
jgi:glutamine amidotransferase PdxT